MAVGCLEICNAACCWNIDPFQLTIEEYFRLISAGAILFRQDDGNNIYRMEGSCPFLDGNRCGVWGTNYQPFSCKWMRFMGVECRNTRFCNPKLVKRRLKCELKEPEDLDITLRAKLAIAYSTGVWIE